MRKIGCGCNDDYIWDDYLTEDLVPIAIGRHVTESGGLRRVLRTSSAVFLTDRDVAQLCAILLSESHPLDA